MTPTRPVLTLSDPGSVVAAVPVLTGFHPRESLVLLALRPPRKRLGLTVRIDVEEADRDPLLLDSSVRAMVRDGATHALIVLFSEVGEHDDDLPYGDLVDEATGRLEESGIEVDEVLCVRRGRWFSYVCRGECCPEEGTPVPTGTSALHAQAVADGRVVLADRRALQRSYAGPEPYSCEALERERLLPALAEQQASRGLSDDERADEAVTLFRRLMHRPAGSGPSVRPDGQVDVGIDIRRLELLLVLLDDRFVRDEVLATVVDAELVDALRLLGDLVRTAVGRWVAVPATMLAWCAWRHGDGSVANVALDLVLAVDPSCVLARHVATALREGIRAEPELGVGRSLRRPA